MVINNLLVAIKLRQSFILLQYVLKKIVVHKFSLSMFSQAITLAVTHILDRQQDLHCSNCIAFTITIKVVFTEIRVFSAFLCSDFVDVMIPSITENQALGKWVEVRKITHTTGFDQYTAFQV